MRSEQIEAPEVDWGPADCQKAFETFLEQFRRDAQLQNKSVAGVLYGSGGGNTAICARECAEEILGREISNGDEARALYAFVQEALGALKNASTDRPRLN